MKMYKTSNGRIMIPLYTKNDVLYIASRQVADWWKILSYDKDFISHIRKNDVFEGEISDGKNLIKKIMRR